MKLTLRDYFWLIFVVALALAWWLDRTRLTSQVRDLEETIFRISPRIPTDESWER